MVTITNGKTGESRSVFFISPRDAVSLAWAGKLDAPHRWPSPFAPVRYLDLDALGVPLVVACGDWWAWAVPQPSARRIHAAEQAARNNHEARKVMLAQRRQRREARRDYLHRKRVHRDRACLAVFAFNYGPTDLSEAVRHFTKVPRDPVVS